MSPTSPLGDVQEWLLRARTYGITEHVSPALLGVVEAEAIPDTIYGGMLARLTAQILTRDLRGYDVTANERVPASWWDQYKLTLWGSVADRPGWQAAAERWLYRRLRLDRVQWREMTATLHVEEFLAYPDADPALTRRLGDGVEKRVITGPRWEPPTPEVDPDE